MREAWATAVGGQPGLVTIVGEAGIGKTALAEFFAVEAAEDGGTVLRTRCYETERPPFLQPIVEAITPVVAAVSASAAPDARRARGGRGRAAARGRGHPRPAAAWTGSMEMERRRAFEAVRAFLRSLAENSPVLVLVDDLQYAGQSTTAHLGWLARLRGRQDEAISPGSQGPGADRTT